MRENGVTRAVLPGFGEFYFGTRDEAQVEHHTAIKPRLTGYGALLGPNPPTFRQATKAVVK